MIVMGLNAWHGDAAASLVIDGRVVAAVEEERFTRIKHWAGFPLQSIRYCLEAGGVGAAEVDHWAINSDDSAHRWRKLAFLARGGGGLRLVRSRLANRRRRQGVAEVLADAFDLPRSGIRPQYLEHHLCHLASALYPSGFERAWALSIDGFGDFASAAWAAPDSPETGIHPRGQVFFPHSLGVFYQAMTQFLGFPAYGDEYKVMGLASYGEPDLAGPVSRLVRILPDGGYELDLRYFRHHAEAITFSFDDGAPRFAPLFSPAVTELLGPPRQAGEDLTDRHRAIAASVQAVYEQSLFHLLRSLHRLDPREELALAGGCGMNSVANGKIRQHTPFRRVYVQPAAGDAGGAPGAALALSRRMGVLGRDPMPDPYLGPGYSDDEIGGILDRHHPAIAAADCLREYLPEDLVLERVVTTLVDGGVVGWFQGRMEWGARALGNRSILGDPRRGDMQEILNRKIKRRESFRPFAPSVLRGHVADWFEQDDDVPFMEKVYRIRPECRGIIPAVTHVDGTGRLQTVEERRNPRYHRLIERFRQRTGVPMLLNTSFNENEPIVCQPGEALDCFLRTRMDLLVMGRHLISRSR